MSSFPVSIKSSEDFKQKIMREGINANIEFGATNLVVPISGSTTIAGATILPTEHFYINSFSGGISNSYATLQVTYYSGATNASPSFRVALGGNSQYQSSQMEQIVYSNSQITALLRNGDGATSILNANASMSGYLFTADMNYNAAKVMMWIGDSISRGSAMGAINFDNSNHGTATTPLDHYAFQVRNYFQLQQNIDCRIINKSMGSATSVTQGYWLKQGYYDVEQCDCLFYQLGVNDATGSTSNAQYLSELNRVIDWRNRKFPNCKIVFVGATPLNNNTNETRLATLRGIMAGLASVPSNIYYVSLANSFDRTVLTNYNLSDGVHPTIASNLLIGNVLNQWILDNNITF
jgi:hypothetical protein